MSRDQRLLIVLYNPLNFPGTAHAIIETRNLNSGPKNLEYNSLNKLADIFNGDER